MIGPLVMARGVRRAFADAGPFVDAADNFVVARLSRDLFRGVAFATVQLADLRVPGAVDMSGDLDMVRFIIGELAADPGLRRDHVEDLRVARGLFRVLRIRAELAGHDDVGCRRLALQFGDLVDTADALIEVLTAVGETEGCADSTVTVLPAARRLTSLAAHLLPAGCRSVKLEEFAAELYDVAAGGSRRQQLGYALRLLATIIPLRRALAGGGERRALERW